jgi:hypothetical protein
MVVLIILLLFWLSNVDGIDERFMELLFIFFLNFIIFYLLWFIEEVYYNIYKEREQHEV